MIKLEIGMILIVDTSNYNLSNTFIYIFLLMNLDSCLNNIQGFKLLSFILILFWCNLDNTYNGCRYVQNNTLSGTVPSDLRNKELVLKWVLFLHVELKHSAALRIAKVEEIIGMLHLWRIDKCVHKIWWMLLQCSVLFNSIIVFMI